MSGLRPPPKRDKPPRVLLRISTVALLVAGAGVVIWAAVTNQRIELTEDVALEELDLDTLVIVEGAALNLVEEGATGPTVVLLHDADIAGGVIWDQVVDQLGDEVSVSRVDLPGFGLSQRFPEEGADHTVASMAERVSALLDQVLDGPAVFAGVGLGGEVAAEVAVTRPELVTGLVLVDVDFYRPEGFLERVERLPWLGLAVTHAFETGGPFAIDRWAPRCGQGGWCPTAAQAEARAAAATLAGTTRSVHAFRRTPPASLVPARLGDITAPVRYLWSRQGQVPQSSVDRLEEALPGLQPDILADAWKAHLDEPDAVAEAILALVGG